MNTKKNVIVVSARRSGTHLLTDLVVNNFGYESINYNYLDLNNYLLYRIKWVSSLGGSKILPWERKAKNPLALRYVQQLLSFTFYNFNRLGWRIRLDDIHVFQLMLAFINDKNCQRFSRCLN